MQDRSVRPIDDSKTFELLLAAYLQSVEGSFEREVRMGQFVAKCGLCSQADWESLDSLLEKAETSPETRAYLRQGASVGRLFCHGSNEEHLEAVCSFSTQYPNDQLLSVPIFWPKGDVQSLKERIEEWSVRGSCG